MTTIFLLLVAASHAIYSVAATNVTNTTVYVISDGEMTELVCPTLDDFNSTSNLSVNWEIDGKILSGELSFDNDTVTVFNVSTNKSLIVRNPRTSRTYGSFNVTCITNITGGTTQRQSYQVMILKAPRFSSNLEIVDVPENSYREINLNCSEPEGLPLPQIDWEAGGNILPKESTYFLNETQPLNLTVSNNGSLGLMRWPGDKGFGVNVTCRANNTQGVDKMVYFVRFLEAPRILTGTSKILVIEDKASKVYINCITTGYPGPDVEWKFGEHELRTRNGTFEDRKLLHVLDGVVRTSTSSFRVFTNGTLLINNPYTKELVPYRNFSCIAFNVAGEDSRTHDFYVGKLVMYSFEVMLAEEEFTGEAQELSKKIQDALLSVKDFYEANITSVNSSSRRVSFDITWLDVDVARYGNPRNVTAMAEDVLAVFEKNNFTKPELIMSAKPAPPTDLTAEDVASNEITINWKRPRYFRVDTYQVQINDGSSGPWRNTKNVPGERRSTTLDGLKQDTKYLIRMESVDDKHGVGDFPSEAIHVQTTKDGTPVAVIVIVVVIVVLIILALVLGILYFRRRPKEIVQEIVLETANPYEDSIPGVSFSNIYVHDNRTFCPTGNLDGSDKGEYFSWLEISRTSLFMGDVLGSGEFGVVMKATWTDEQTNNEIPVAVKSVKGNATDTDRKELFKELRLMADVAEHPNVVNLIGACSVEGPLWVVVEFCEHGNLLSFLKKNRKESSKSGGSFDTSLDPLVRVRIAYDASKGMRHLEEKKIVHRDLAARNILLGKNKIAKISDFGLSRDIYEVGLYQKNTGGKLPVKWMAIESLQEATYTSKSDVWSFGVLFWEIETAGMVPYPGISGRDLLGYLLNGNRLNQSPDTSSEMYDLMKKCWEPSPKLRPHFNEIESILEAYLEEQADYVPVVIDEEVASGDGAYINYCVEVDEEETRSTSL